MLRYRIDTERAIAAMTHVGKQQLPFAAALAINRTLEESQTAIRRSIRRRFILRQPRWVDQSVKINRGGFATKKNLRGILELDPPSRGGANNKADVLGKFEDESTKRPRQGGHSIAIPAGVKRGKRDQVRAADRPRAFEFERAFSSVSTRTTIYKGARRTFMIQRADGSGFIFRRKGKGKSAGLQLLYLLKPAVSFSPELHFYDTARKTIDERYAVNFDGALSVALRDAK